MTWADMSKRWREKRCQKMKDKLFKNGKLDDEGRIMKPACHYVGLI